MVQQIKIIWRPTDDATHATLRRDCLMIYHFDFFMKFLQFVRFHVWMCIACVTVDWWHMRSVVIAHWVEIWIMKMLVVFSHSRHHRVLVVVIFVSIQWKCNYCVSGVYSTCYSTYILTVCNGWIVAQDQISILPITALNMIYIRIPYTKSGTKSLCFTSRGWNVIEKHFNLLVGYSQRNTNAWTLNFRFVVYVESIFPSADWVKIWLQIL